MPMSIINLYIKFTRRWHTEPRWIGPRVREHTDGLVQERRNSSALAMELRLSCTNPSIQSTASLQYGSIFWYYIKNCNDIRKSRP